MYIVSWDLRSGAVASRRRSALGRRGPRRQRGRHSPLSNRAGATIGVPIHPTPATPVKLWSILGNSQSLDGGAMFGNAPRAMWARWLPPDAQNRMPLACRALLVESASPASACCSRPASAASSSRRCASASAWSRIATCCSIRWPRPGSRHEDIDVVVLSHLHFDHAGGLLAPWREGAAPALLFPNARFVVGERVLGARAAPASARPRLVHPGTAAAARSHRAAGAA